MISVVAGEVGGDLSGGGGQDDLAQAHGFFLIEAGLFLR